MKIIGQIGRDVGGQTGSDQARNGGTRGMRSRLAKSISGEDATDVHLIRRVCGDPVIVIGPGKVPLLAKIVIDTSYAKVIITRKDYRSLIALTIQRIAEIWVVR